MAQHVRTVENLPEEAAALAEVASRLIEADPASGPAVAELAGLLASRVAASILPSALALAIRMLREDAPGGTATALPSSEQGLWEDAGASFRSGALEENAFKAAAAFSDLVMNSLEGDGSVATRLEVDRSRVSQRVRERSLYSFSRNDTRFYPRWQFAGAGTIPGLRQVLTSLDEELHPLVVDHWFTTPSVDLEIGDAIVSPVGWLATGGNPHVVAELAADL